jgi:hypothetical protein
MTSKHRGSTCSYVATTPGELPTAAARTQPVPVSTQVPVSGAFSLGGGPPGRRPTGHELTAPEEATQAGCVNGGRGHLAARTSMSKEVSAEPHLPPGHHRLNHQRPNVVHHVGGLDPPGRPERADNVPAASPVAKLEPPSW